MPGREPGLQLRRRLRNFARKLDAPDALRTISSAFDYVANNFQGHSMQRRAFLTATGALVTASWLPSARAAEADLFPIVETAEGRVRGLVSGGIAVFKGLPYGADTSGRNRFMPPQPVKKWSGIRDAFDYGNIAPQIPGDRRRGYADLILNDIRPGGMGEDCLVLNLWTPEPKTSSKRPWAALLRMP